MPLENSTDGRVADTLDMFMRLPQLKICAEVRLRIHHNLLANCEQAEIRRVYSKPQALSQCRNWLARTCRTPTLHEVSSTADAAQLAQTRAGRRRRRQPAGGGPLRPAHPLPQTSRTRRTTRRASPSSATQTAARTGNDKTALMFQVAAHPGLAGRRPGRLQAEQDQPDLDRVVPAPRSAKPEYVFFVDFEGHREDPKVKQALTALEEHCEQLTVLGSFPMATIVSE